ncbi:MAG: hypothetical protein IJG94_03085 [Clostridia bacterium]|nr:hypothetical protein [Clostridia bacterium]
MKKAVFSLLAAAILFLSASLAEKPLPSREYFENLDKGSRLEDIVEDIGQGGVKGSGIIFHTWHLEDGSEASVIFDSKGRINMIYIQNENRSERIYKRLYILTEEGIISPDVPDADLKVTIKKMNQAMNEHLPPSARMSFAGPAQTDIALYDLTGDGSPDLFTNDTWGSGMVRTDLIAYDPVEEKLYVLDGYNYDYLIDKVEKDRIVIAEEGPHGYGDPVTKTYGTVKLENGKLVFIPDSEDLDAPKNRSD